MIGRIILGVIALVVIVGGVMAAPDLIRYMKIRAM
jgi:glucose uptake protein GlcU